MSRVIIDNTNDVVGWENYLGNRGNTREISYHGGGTCLSIYFDNMRRCTNCSDLYSTVVQAALNKWEEFEAIKYGAWESNPIHSVAEAAFAGRSLLFMEDFRESYGRLWKESPRPHTSTHKYIALNSQGELPVTRAEIGLMFDLPGWSLIAVRIANRKGWLNDSIALMGNLFEIETELSTPIIIDLVRLGFPKEKGLRWINVLNHTDPYSKKVKNRWESELTK